MRGHIRPARSQAGAEGRAWDLVVAATNPEGHRARKWVRFTGSRRAAEKELVRLQHLADTHELPAAGHQTVGAYLAAWLAAYSKRRLTGQSPKTYAYAVKRLSGVIGHYRLDRLQPAHIQAAYDGFLAEGAAPGTVCLCHDVLHKALRQAVRLRILAVNPADAVEAPASRVQRTPKALTREQALAFIQAAHVDPQGLPAILALGLGVRLGEALALQWPDIGFDAAVVNVRRSLLPGSIYKAPKSGKGRMVSLPRFIAIALRERLAEHQVIRAQAGAGWNPDNLVCPGVHGQPQYRDTTPLMRRLCDRAKIPVMTFHSLRHTCASLLLADGEPVKTVQELLGHSSPTITLNVYAHVLPGMQEQTAARLDTLLGSG